MNDISFRTHNPPEWRHREEAAKMTTVYATLMVHVEELPQGGALRFALGFSDLRYTLLSFQ